MYVFSPIGKCKTQMEIHGNAKLKNISRSVQFNATQFKTHVATNQF